MRATTKVKLANKLLGISLPYEEDTATLRDILEESLKKGETDIGVGACAYIADVGLRIAKITNGKITRIEVIRSIH